MQLSAARIPHTHACTACTANVACTMCTAYTACTANFVCTMCTACTAARTACTTCTAHAVEPHAPCKPHAGGAKDSGCLLPVLRQPSAPMRHKPAGRQVGGRAGTAPCPQVPGRRVAHENSRENCVSLSISSVRTPRFTFCRSATSSTRASVLALPYTGRFSWAHLQHKDRASHGKVLGAGQVLRGPGPGV